MKRLLGALRGERHAAYPQQVKEHHMKLTRKILLFVFSLALAILASPAQALPSNQVLVLTTATQVDTAAFAFRYAVIIQNNGPNAIHCRVGSATGLLVGYGHRILPGDAWSVPVRQAIPIYCITSANQVAGAATDVTEF